MQRWRDGAGMAKSIPKHMQHLIVPYDWDVHQVWKLSAPVEIVSIAELAFLLESPLWSRDPASYTDFDLSPNEVLADLSVSSRHAKRIEAAETSWPLDFIFSENRLWPLDGMHRLAKLKMEGMLQVSIRKHPASIRAFIEV
jgi:hypothetical protein